MHARGTTPAPAAGGAGTVGAAAGQTEGGSFSTYAAAPGQNQGLYQLGQIILLVLIGCAVGFLVHVLVLPPMRYRSAKTGIHALGHSLCDLVADMYPALWDGELEKERTQEWRYRSTYLGANRPSMRTPTPSTGGGARSRPTASPRSPLRPCQRKAPSPAPVCQSTCRRPVNCESVPLNALSGR